MNAKFRKVIHPTGDVIIIKDSFTEMFLMRTGKGFIAVDSGFHSSRIRKGLAYHNIQPEDVQAVFITHSDIDHYHAAGVFTRARFYFPEKELEMIENKIPRLKYFPFIKTSIRLNHYTTVSDNDSIEIDNLQVKCISLPGHTLGSMGYIIDGKYLFSGDAFRIKNGRIAVPHLKLFVMDLNEMKKSIEKVCTLTGIQYIFTSHSGSTAEFSFAISK
jgi:glyoxylase-like metal-dependent hydrolase (beta-lactamase superfamily II)